MEHGTTQSAAITNTLFAVQRTDRDTFLNPFPGGRRITLAPDDPDDAALEVIAGSGAHVETSYDESSGVRAYFWGLAGHPNVDRANLPGWIARVVLGTDWSALRELAGTFIALIDDRPRRTIHMVCDHVGLRPWFVGQHQGRLVCGSDVWAIRDAGLNDGPVNYDAVASWLRYNFNCTGESLFANFVQMNPGSVATCKDGKLTQSDYARYTGGRERASHAELAAGIHERMSRAFDAITRDQERVSVALSGGYDSRYLAALAAQRPRLKVEAFNIRDREAEGTAATLVAKALGIDLHVLHTDGSLWNIFDDPYHFTADGFPMTKQLSHVAALQRPGMPCLNGFIGDPIVRGTIDRAENKLENEVGSEDPAVLFQRIHWLKPWQGRIDLIDPRIVARADERTTAIWRRHLANWEETGHPFFAANVFVRQRHYLSNNFLQHLDVAEAIVPFATWELIDFKLKYDSTCFGWETYDTLFKTFYPQIAPIPHNSKMGENRNELINLKSSRRPRRWAAQVLAALPRAGSLSIVSRRKSIPRLAGAMMGRYDVEIVATFLYRLWLLEQRLRNARVAFDWQAI